MKSVYTIATLALISSSQAINLSQNQHMHSQNKHACDFVDDNGEEVSTSLMPEYVQLNDDDATAETATAAPASLAQDDVASTREKFQQMQAQMDAAVAQADQKRAEQ